MQTEFENMNFRELKNDSGHKTFECVTKTNNLIGTIGWSDRINQFTFRPFKDSQYIAKALGQIADFIRQLGR